MEDLVAQTVRISENIDTAIDQMDSLTEIMNTYEPETRQALEDARTFTDAAAKSVSALVDAARSAEDLARSSGTA
jgi:ABC-type transporter Mla subunit MlaD